MYPNCPQCNSNKVRKFGKGFFFALFFFGGGVIFWLGFLFFPFFIIAALLILGSSLAFFLPASYQCQECKKSFVPPKPQKELHS